MKKLLALLILISTPAYADLSSHLNVEEVDGSPSTFPYKLKVSNGTLTDNGDGTSSVTTGGGGGTPGGNTTEVQFNQGGAFSGDSALNWSVSNNTLSISRDSGQTGVALRISSDTGTTLATISHDGSAWFNGTNFAIGNKISFDSATGIEVLGGQNGISLSADSGVLTIRGVGNTNNENLQINLESTSNAAAIGSSTGLNKITFGTISMLNAQSSGLTQLNISNSSGSGNSGFTVIAGDAFNSSNTAAAYSYGITGGATKAGTTGGNSGTLRGTTGTAIYSSTGTQVDAYGLYGLVQKTTSASGVITDAYSVYGDTPTAAGGGTITRPWSAGFPYQIRLGPIAGTALSGDAGVLTVASTSNTNNENIKLDLEGQANTMAIKSTSGVGVISFDTATTSQLTLYGQSAGGCIMFQDTDGAGCTKCNALNGTLSCVTDADCTC